MKKWLPLLLCALLLTPDVVYAMPAEQNIEPVELTDTEGEESTEENVETTENTEETQSEENAESMEDAVAEGTDSADKAAEDTENQNDAGTSEEETSAGIEVSAPSAILMEKSTGTVIYEKDADTERAPASVTKVMTMLLIFDALENGKIKLEDEVTTSEYAASMGGSQVFLEPGEVQTVDTLLKCIAVASANDACVAMAEYISGSEEAFVNEMNDRAKGLGMDHTHFVNCNGLDAEGHLTTARDIALMSRELMTEYPQVQDYSMIWMENITHTTSKGTSEFGLTNTNKMVRQYEYATGLKTGSTGNAKFCVSATAEKNGIELIAVIMAAETSKERFQDATSLLNFGFGKCQLYEDQNPPALEPVEVTGGVADEVSVSYEKTFTYLDMSGVSLNEITAEQEIRQEVPAPVRKGDVVGQLKYQLNGQEIGTVNILAEESVEKAGFLDYLKKAFLEWTI